MKSRLKATKYPLLLSIASFVLIIAFYPTSFNKQYILQHLDNKGPLNLYQYYDMDSDGISELIHLGYNRLGDQSFPFIRIMKGSPPETTVIEQINLKNEKLPYYPSVICGDYDKDDLAECYTFSFKDSTLYLESFEYDPEPSGIELFLHKEIVALNRYKNKLDGAIHPVNKLVDINNDGYDEVVFIVLGLYSATPRGFFAYDIKNDSLLRSNTGSIAIKNPEVLKYGHKTYFSGFSTPLHNCKTPLSKLNDHFSWAFLMDESLQLMFDPDPTKKDKYEYNVRNFPLLNNGKVLLLSFFEVPKNSDEKNYIRIYDSSGYVLMEKTMEVNGRMMYKFSDPENARLTLGKYRSDLCWELSIQDSILLRPLPGRKAKILNSTWMFSPFPSKKNNLLGMDFTENNLKLMNSRLRTIAEIQLHDFKKTSVLSIKSNGKSHDIAISDFYSTDFIRLSSNPSWAYRHLYWSILFLCLLLLFLSLKWVFNLQLRRQQIARNTLTKNQLALSKKQLEPHFMLNMLNNIGYMFTHHEKDEAQYYFGKYASLLRRGLSLADKVETTLQEELEFIKDYLVLQKKRLEGDLEYRINIQDVNPENIKIPHSLVYTFVENAVKHGLTPKKDKRELSISISESGKKVTILIRDNGIGRAASKNISKFSTGKGLEIVDSIIDGYNRLYKQRIKYSVSDLEEKKGIAVGTEVKIFI